MKTLFIVSVIGMSLLSHVLSAQGTKTTVKMKEYILLIRLPLSYGAEQAKEVRPQWDQILQKWKAEGTFLTSYIAPNDGYIVSGPERISKKEVVISDGLRIVSTIIIQAESLESAVEIAKVCPILTQGGTVEIKEIQPRAVPAQK